MALFPSRLMNTRTFWKYDKPEQTGGRWGTGDDAGKWIPSQSEGTPTYTEFQGTEEPFRKGSEQFTAPEGVRSSDMRIVRSEYRLQTANDHRGKETIADVVYMPQDTNREDPFMVMDVAIWDATEYGFKLLPSFTAYLCVRKNKVGVQT